MSASLKTGDYVLGTKWSDGDPQDHWAVGFYDGKLRDQHLVRDAQFNQFRASGFRRVKKISAERGKWLLDNSEQIEKSNRSMWHWLRAPMSHSGDSK